MCSACRFCLSVYLDLSPRGMRWLLSLPSISRAAVIASRPLRRRGLLSYLDRMRSTTLLCCALVAVGAGARALAASPEAVQQTVFDGGLKGGWQDWGWAKR